ncbi:MAG: NAD+ synthase [Chloroflexi bacterium]|nr:NAD+ synthase [Chloroflexota bacterium]
MRSLRIALAQINTTVGDLDGNAWKIVQSIRRAKELGTDIVAFPELAVTGYPPEDLVLKPKFVADNVERLRDIAAETEGIVAIVGFVDLQEDLYNAAAVIQNRSIVGVYRKMFLPTYGVFDEDRYFQAGAECPVFAFGDTVLGVNICEDIWYPVGPATAQAFGGAELIVNINGSPYHVAKSASRERMLATRAVDELVIVAYVNMVGGQDELVFDGGSVIFDQRGEVVARGSQFEEDLVVADLDIEAVFRTRLHDPRRRKGRHIFESLGDPAAQLVGSSPLVQHPKPPLSGSKPKLYIPPGNPGEVYAALVLGTHDYASKNGFKQVVIGLSGGIDSSLTAVIAADALGPQNVFGVRMPSRFTSQPSMEDAEQLALNLGIHLLTVPIEPPFQAMLETLAEAFRGTAVGIAEENLQARIRGNILMALSNKFGYLVLTTGNKSELAVGYSTLYGDMAGGYNLLKDVVKTEVYELARYRNGKEAKAPIPERVFTKAPSAELRPNQRDEDTLPTYDMLDPIVKAYVEEDKSFEEIVALGYDEQMVKRVISMIDKSEYKRRQAPPGIKITPRAFGRDRRLPITNAYRQW